MIRASFGYVAREGGRFDFDYYTGPHMALVRRLLGPAGLVRAEVDRGVSGEEPGSVPRYAAAGHLYFPSADAFHRALVAHGDELGRDMANYTDLELETQVSEIISS